MTINSDAPALAELRSRDGSPEHRALLSEQHQRIEEQIAKLPKMEQEVVLLRLGQGLSYKQIADITDLSVSHVGVLLHQAVIRLKKSIVVSDSIAGA